jgi:hypothetical protein
MTYSTKLCTAEGKMIHVCPGSKELPYKKDIFPVATSLRVDESGEGTEFTFHECEEEPNKTRSSYIRPNTGNTEFIFPHWRDIKESQRMVTGGADATHVSRYFRLVPLRSGGFYIQTWADSTLFWGVDKEGFIVLTKIATPFFRANDTE